MPIKGRSDIYRVPRVGKIHLGVKKVSDKSGHEYPSAVDYFVVKADDTTSEAAAQAFQSVYGDKPREITICFPSDDPDQFFPQWLSSYRSVGGRYELFCRGDGEVAYRVDGQGGRVQMPCAYQDCPLYQEKNAKSWGNSNSSFQKYRYWVLATRYDQLPHNGESEQQYSNVACINRRGH
ncbi:hypothetical protein FY534_13620 (plasmid) [Alicyclobacillus sp. TC]|uniref:recombination directionality factor n=1 Tax=Alicyclobacillus sp. TC TaxID=2606450 RepID=UPI0019342C52|nr:hypothetical protein [Alicyclobacillus sp. TC]QRF24951.1 hypothetical protein FY534_13620 [Alicyclobacillus sp. TC]